MPADVEPISWRLLTNRTTASLDDIIELIDWFRRWKTFNILKKMLGTSTVRHCIAHLMRWGANRPRSGRGIVL
ncbi:hypothetical protein ACFS07_30200 [Undibacterium arcticum]